MCGKTAMAQWPADADTPAVPSATALSSPMHASLSPLRHHPHSPSTSTTTTITVTAAAVAPDPAAPPAKGLACAGRVRGAAPTHVALVLCFAISCLLTLLVRNVSICYSPWAWQYTHRCESSRHAHPWASQPHHDGRRETPSSPASLRNGSEWRIAIAMIVDDFFPRDVRAATIENKRRYAARWGYHVEVPDGVRLRGYAAGLPVAWAKFPILLDLLERFDYVFMIDADAVFLRDDVNLHAAVRVMENDGTSLLISNDINGPNSGVFMMRRSDWSRKFLRLAIEAAPLLSVKSPWLPLRYENRAFFYLLDAWPSCACMRRLDSMLAPVHREARQLRRSVTTVDRCLLNRRPARGTAFEEFFNDVGSSFDDISDAFIAHAAGGNVTDKANALRHMLSFAFLNSTAAS